MPLTVTIQQSVLWVMTLKFDHHVLQTVIHGRIVAVTLKHVLIVKAVSLRFLWSAQLEKIMFPERDQYVR